MELELAILDQIDPLAELAFATWSRSTVHIPDPGEGEWLVAYFVRFHGGPFVEQRRPTYTLPPRILPIEVQP